MIAQKKKRIAIFASGTGSNAAKIIAHFKKSDSIETGLIVCNNPQAGVIAIAEKNNIPCLLITKKEFPESGNVKALQDADVSLIVLAGFLWKVPAILIHHFRGKIINIHPALLPGYGGKGMYGMAVHKAVIEAKEKFSGITIHFVDEEYDHGNIIFQEKVTIDPGETPESLAEKIHQLEHEHFSKVIEQVLNEVPN